MQTLLQIKNEPDVKEQITLMAPPSMTSRNELGATFGVTSFGRGC